MSWNFNSLNFFAKGFSIMCLIFLSFIGLHIITNIIKSKESICDVEKQSKFILECLSANEIKELQAIGACEQMSIRLYCKN
jgi:hypothetical protein